MNITLNTLPSCHLCGSFILPISDGSHNSQRTSGFFGDSVSTSSATSPFSSWRCSKCGHYPSKSHSGSYEVKYRPYVGFSAEENPVVATNKIDWKKTCNCNYCVEKLKERNYKEKLELELYED